MHHAQPPRTSVDEYLAFEDASDTKHEFVNGEIVAMSGASIVHNLIAANVTRALGNALRDRPCVVLTSDQRVHITATDLFAYPDVTVVCGRVERHPKNDRTLTNPTLVVEVLSDSTEAYDRGAKLLHYQVLPSLQDYVLVSTREKRVDHYHRESANEWHLTVHTAEDAALGLTGIGAKVAMAEIYEKVDLVAKAGPVVEELD